MARGGTRSRHNRRARRAALRQTPDTLAASGSTSLPLSDRDVPWDAAAAKASLDPGQFANAHFWRDGEKPADQITSFKLGFAKNSPPLTAVWRGVTAAAGAMSGARGGVDIPSGDEAGVKSRIGSYYTKAAAKYDDPSIKTPWSMTLEDAAGVLRARGWEPGPDYAEKATPQDVTAIALAHAEAADDKDFEGRLAHWGLALAVDEADVLEETHVEEAAVELAVPAADPDADPVIRFAPAAGDECADCGHPYSDHGPMEAAAAAAMGACTADGCDCDGFEVEVNVDGGDTGDGEEPPSGNAANTMTVVIKPELDEAAFAAVQARVATLSATLSTSGNGANGATNFEVTTAPGFDPPADVPAADQPTNASSIRWEAVIAPEGKPTDDYRMFAPGSITWRDLPLTLMAQLETADGHDGAGVAGRIDQIWRDGGQLRAQGVFDEGDFGQEVARMVADGVLRGISVDIAVHNFEVGHMSDFLDADGNWIAGAEERAREEEPADLVDILLDAGDEPAVYVVTEGVIGAVTVCSFPAFADASISLAAAAHWTIHLQGGFTAVRDAGAAQKGAGDAADAPAAVSLTASAAGLAPEQPPAGWFADPALGELTPLVVTDEGRVYGHGAAWGICHIGIPDVCTTAPRSNTSYAYFHLKEVECAGGERVACGTITLETGHADRQLGRQAAQAHYDHTGLAVADVICGEDEHGIWVAGALRPDVDADKARALRGAVLSGDWRKVNGGLELVALLAVNVPGFPVVRPKASVEAGEDGVQVLALVAAGVHDGTHVQTLVTATDRRRLGALAAQASGRFDELARRARGS